MSTLNLELPKLVERIDMRLPPNEYFDGGKNIVADPRSALNAGWVAWLGEQKKHGCPGNKGISGLEKINQLTMKAVEYICLQQEWNEAQLLNGGEPQ